MTEDLDALLEKLNPEQRRAATCPPGPMLILAGAGSGKTRVLTHRLAWLIERQGVRPWNILAVTFTNKAAGEMAARVSRLLPACAESLQVSTFHSTAAFFLRRHVDRLGFNPDYVIYDDSDQLVLLRRVVEELGLPKNAGDPRLFRAMIDRAKNSLQWPEEVEAGKGPAAAFPAVYARYQARLKASNALDFGDLLLFTVRILEEHDDVRQAWQAKIQHLLIDEYQDTNHAQYRLARLLTNPTTRSLTVVGDEDQSIYAFRGADISNILNFTRDFPDATVIKLEQNYRSTQTILSAAGAVVSRNGQRMGKTLWTDRGQGEPIRYLEVDSEAEEASRVAEEILRLRARDLAFGDMAVFYRANSQSRAFEEVFGYRNVPYLLVGQGFYDRKEIKDARAYLQLIFNPLDDAALERILNEPPRGIGDKARTWLLTTASAQGVACHAVLQDLAAGRGEKTSAAPKLLAFFHLLEELRAAARTLKVRELLEQVLERTGYRERLSQEGDIEGQSRLENLRELVNVAADFDIFPGWEGLRRFLERISLHSQADELEDDQGRVTLMTLHNAKGLEFPVVFMAGMEDGLFPHSRTLQSELEIEEERRLCYVGMTRAMQRLFLLRARRRRFQDEIRQTQPSRFLKEIPPELMVGQKGLGVGDIARRYGVGGPPRGPNLGGNLGPPSASREGTPRGFNGLFSPSKAAEGPPRGVRPDRETEGEGEASPFSVSGFARRFGVISGGKEGLEPAVETEADESGPRGPVLRGAGLRSGGPPAVGVGQERAAPGWKVIPFPPGLAKPSQEAPESGEAEEPGEPEAVRGGKLPRGGADEGPFRDLQPGRRVQHPSFGEGVIREREGSPDNPRLTVEFRQFGKKRLMARFASLELIFRG